MAVRMWPALIGVVAALACARDVKPPNLVLITLDTLRADHLGCYGYFRDTSPNLDALAGRSILFERCYSPVSSTLPSHVTMLSGTYPIEHGVDHIFRKKKILVWPEGLTSYSDVLAENGYVTAAFVSAVPLSQATGIDRGFGVFDEPSGARRSAEETNELVFDWLDAREEGPTFLWVHYFDPHGPHRAPPSFAEIFEADDRLDSMLTAAEYLERWGDRTTADLMNEYDGQIRYMDHHIGLLLDRLRRELGQERTILIVVGDHGEGLGQHGCVNHGRAWHEQLHVPFFVHGPGIELSRVPEVLSTADILPTLLALVPDLPSGRIAGQLSGRNALVNKPPPADGVFGQVRMAASDTVGSGEYIYTLTTRSWRYFLSTVDTSESLFHLRTDPFELRDVALGHPDTLRSLRVSLLEQIEKMENRARRLCDDQSPRTRPRSPRHVEQLRALGYVD